MVYVLTFLACLAGHAGAQCRDVEIVWDGTPFQCILFGQVEIARWIREHPEFVATRGYRCQPGREV
jgi:hypothetical protein